MWEGFIILARMAALIYVGLCMVLAGCQRSMMYLPARSTEAAALLLGESAGLSAWRNPAGELIGWQALHQPVTRNAILIFHGNAGSAAHRSYLVYGFQPALAGYVLEYPGYGSRSGSPAETAFYTAAEEAFQQLQPHYDHIYLAGESMGCGVATHLAAKYPDRVAGLVLITAFDSLTEVARHHYPIFPVRLLMRDRFESAEHLKSYQGPVAIMLAEEDEVVPFRFGKRLHDGYDGPKKLWVQSGRSHNTLDYSSAHPWWHEVQRFLNVTQSSTAR
jgi:pimeloyl-ACP methyl ester carboxylesterase